MKTKIFKTYADFLNRKDKSVNGVSPEFTELHPEYNEMNSSNWGCWNCVRCENCIDCTDCKRCLRCHRCENCSDCSQCIRCTSCKSCVSCPDCVNCSSCVECSYFTSNPQRIVSPVLGSRSEQTTYYWTETYEQVVCGCFIGTLDEFRQAVLDRHGFGSEHGTAYLKWIETVKAYKNAN